jgi:L-ascorbate metabolism protein UlaG (beta-lactamase superfamily)
LEKRGWWPSFVENEGVPRLHEKLEPADIAVTFVNHATFLIQMPGVNILTDPVWSERAGPFGWIGPRRVRRPGVGLDELPDIDLILISHNHYDHLDIRTLRKLHGKFTPKVLVAAGDKKLVESSGMKDVRELDWWEEVQIGSGMKVTVTPTQHFSARGLFDRQQSLWGGYMIQNMGRRIYFGGDAGYSSHFAEIRRRLGSPDIALLGIGAYEPRWFMRAMHMNPAEGVRAHEDLGSKQSIGMHFGTFRMSAEAFDQPGRDLKLALVNTGIAESRFVILHEGETRVYGESL